MNAPTSLQLRVQACAEHLVKDLHGARSVLVATADGFEVAAAGLQDDAARLAAMTSSIAAICEVVGRETALGQAQCLVIDAEHGFLLVRSTQCEGVPLVLNLVTDRQALLGLAMHMVNGAARQLEVA